MSTARLRNVVFACIAVSAVAIVTATFWDYPEWMWLPLFLGIVVPPMTGGVALIALVGKLVARRGASS